MKAPPLLLGAALVFWGWQTGFVVPGVVMAVVLEGARLTKARWELSDQDITRVWTFCSLLLLAALVFAFTDNSGPADFLDFLQNPNYSTQRHAGNSSARTAAATLRWLPMLFFLFAAAQTYSTREGIPLEVISLILRRRWKKARQLGLPPPPSHSVNVAYPYFALCLLAASVHAGGEGGHSFFWGLSVLLGWALWPHRARRFSFVVWAGALVAAVAVGYLSQRALSQLQRYLDNFNPQWLANLGRHRFDPTQSRTQLGQVGRVQASGAIVVRLAAENGPPGLLREATYRTYKAPTWYAETLESDWADVNSTEPNGTTYRLLPGKTSPLRLNIACYLSGGSALLPLPAGSGRLEELLAIKLQRSTLGAVLEEGPGLVVFNAFYGPGATLDSPGNTNQDLAVPEREIPALDQVIAELHLAGQSRKQILQAVSAFFQQKFTYSTWQEDQPRARTNETVIGRFLLRTRSGHCEYFATATVLLLRRFGIPTRYALGYAVHEGAGQNYVVRQRDAHAWCLVWDNKAGYWQDFDTTPASWVEAEASRASPLQWLSDAWSRVGFELAKFRWGQGHLRPYLLLAVAPILMVLLYQILFRRRQRQRRRGLTHGEPAVVWPGLDSEFYRLERRLAQRGLVRQPSEPLSAWFQRAANDPALAELRTPLQELLRLHYRYRFDPQGLSRDEREELRGKAKICLAKEI